MGLGQESDREGELASWEAASSAWGVRVHTREMQVPKSVVCGYCSKQICGREGLHTMTASMRLMHEGCGSGHITVGGADDDLRKALTIARHRASGSALEPYTGASRAGMSLKTQNKCGLGQLRLAAGGPGPGERQRRRGGELRAGNSASWHFYRDKVTRGLSSLSAHPLAFSVALLAQAHQYQV